MLAYVGLLSVVLTFPVCFSVTCEQSYDPSRYIGKARVPVDCKTESLRCPRSWKAGVPEISSDSSNAFDKMVDTNFLYCHEGFTKCGYVPIDARNGQVLGHSGVTEQRRALPSWAYRVTSCKNLHHTSVCKEMKLPVPLFKIPYGFHAKKRRRRPT
ncbi:hypothetical protein P5673_018660 [Acropora cervicornis]|uniref:Secreted protein n=1 Tax=Acropora cervicornis TaxID=6130 RepID=A0AAD9QDQ2_ACRCE|nr:hypothetical protein P5673_018660 [Acropora cervicornis]